MIQTMSSSGYTHKIISYGDDNVPPTGEDGHGDIGDIFAGMGAVVGKIHI